MFNDREGNLYAYNQGKIQRVSCYHKVKKIMCQSGILYLTDFEGNTRLCANVIDESTIMNINNLRVVEKPTESKGFSVDDNYSLQLQMSMSNRYAFEDIEPVKVFKALKHDHAFYLLTIENKVMMVPRFNNKDDIIDSIYVPNYDVDSIGKDEIDLRTTLHSSGKNVGEFFDNYCIRLSGVIEMKLIMNKLFVKTAENKIFAIKTCRENGRYYYLIEEVEVEDGVDLILSKTYKIVQMKSAR
jgi:hypothetical protein